MLLRGGEGDLRSASDAGQSKPKTWFILLYVLVVNLLFFLYSGGLLEDVHRYCRAS